MKPYVEVIPGSNVKFEMVPIPGGSFRMGSPAKEPKRSVDEGPQHSVTIPPFWMEKTEATWDEYDLFALSKYGPKKTGQSVALDAQAEKDRAADAITRPTPPYADPTFGYGRKGHPVISITHHAAVEYCRWLSVKTGKTYRLPTEAEWEYACRAGSKTAYSFGDSARDLSRYAWYLDNSEAMPHAVGLKKPNAWGLYDMHGNVAEWCLDLYNKEFYKTFDPLVPVEAPVLMPEEQAYPHVVRGGSWDDDASRLRCAARRASTVEWNRQDPQRPRSIWWLTDALFVGFRVVRPLEGQENLKEPSPKVSSTGER
jgi:formylglycine-generating enzyme required for sulfatase activity